MLQQTLPGRIHRPGSVSLRHLGEAGWGSGVSRRGAGRLAGFLFQSPYMQAFTLGCSFGFRLACFICLGCHGFKLLITTNYPPAGSGRLINSEYNNPCPAKSTSRVLWVSATWRRVLPPAYRSDQGCPAGWMERLSWPKSRMAAST